MMYTNFNIIHDAINDGLNIKLLLIATGLSESDFKKYLEDDLFSVAQRTAIKETIRDWRVNS